MIGVKICGLTQPHDARAAVAAGADAIGLVFAPSLRQVTLGQAKKIMDELPPHIVRVGVFVDEDPAKIRHILETLGLDRLQFHGQEPSGVLRCFPASRVIRALRPQAGARAPRRDPEPAAGAFLVDAYVAGIAGGTGRTGNWSYARGLKKIGKPVILSGGLRPDNVAEAIRRVRPDMVDVSSGVESRPGKKSAAAMQTFIQRARQCDRALGRHD